MSPPISFPIVSKYETLKKDLDQSVGVYDSEHTRTYAQIDKIYEDLIALKAQLDKFNAVWAKYQIFPKDHVDIREKTSLFATSFMEISKRFYKIYLPDSIKSLEKKDCLYKRLNRAILARENPAIALSIAEFFCHDTTSYANIFYEKETVVEKSTKRVTIVDGKQKVVDELTKIKTKKVHKISTHEEYLSELVELSQSQLQVLKIYQKKLSDKLFKTRIYSTLTQPIPFSSSLVDLFSQVKNHSLKKAQMLVESDFDNSYPRQLLNKVSRYTVLPPAVSSFYTTATSLATRLAHLPATSASRYIPMKDMSSKKPAEIEDRVTIEDEKDGFVLVTTYTKSTSENTSSIQEHQI